VAIVEISCVHVWQEISNYLEGELAADVRERMEAHLKGCVHCTAILDGAKNVVALVADGKTFDLPHGFSQRLKQRLASELPRK
jgi:anti-sigma factor RsiW